MLEVDTAYGKRQKLSCMKSFISARVRKDRPPWQQSGLLTDHAKPVGQVETWGRAFQAEEMGSTKAKS